MMTKKICFFGLGSIGKRHLKNLRRLESQRNDRYEIHAFRSSGKKLPNEIQSLLDKQIFDVSEIDTYDIAFITNPTIFHFKTIKEMIYKTNDMFIEKPILSGTNQKLGAIPFNQSSIYYTACPLRFNRVIDYLHKNLKEQSFFAVRIICSSYLPNWRKGVDYRGIYSAKKELGGGVSIDLIHELDYLKYLFGQPEKVINVRGKYSNLEINTDDLSLYIFEYADKLIELHLDYFGRIAQRKMEIYTDEDVLFCDLIKNEIQYPKKEQSIHFEREDMYLREMTYFLNQVEKREKTFNEPKEAYKTLGLCEGKIR